MIHHVNVISIDGFTWEGTTLVEARHRDVPEGRHSRAFKIMRQDTLLKSRVSDLYIYSQSVVKYIFNYNSLNVAQS